MSYVQFLMSWGRLLNSIAAESCSVPGTVDGSRRRSQEDLRTLAGLCSTSSLAGQNEIPFNGHQTTPRLFLSYKEERASI